MYPIPIVRAAMPDSDPASPSEPSVSRNLPVPVARPAPVAPESADGWLKRTLRAILGLRSSTVRSNLRDVLEDGAGETGFSPTERTMLKNILGLRERRVADVMRIKEAKLRRRIVDLVEEIAGDGDD